MPQRLNKRMAKIALCAVFAAFVQFVCVNPFAFPAYFFLYPIKNCPFWKKFPYSY